MLLLDTHPASQLPPPRWVQESKVEGVAWLLGPWTGDWFSRTRIQDVEGVGQAERRFEPVQADLIFKSKNSKKKVCVKFFSPARSIPSAEIRL